MPSSWRLKYSLGTVGAATLTGVRCCEGRMVPSPLPRFFIPSGGVATSVGALPGKPIY